MPQRIFKRKSSGKSTRNSEPSADGNRIESSALLSPTNDGTTPKSESTIPNRIFIGGIPSNANEWDIRSKFANYGNVRAVKIIRDETGISRGYGFVTFNTDEEAKAVLEKVEVFIKGKKLNIAPAIKKQNYRSEPQSSGSSSAESRSDCTTEELCKNSANSRFCRLLERPCEMRSPVTNELIPYPSEVPMFLDGGALVGASDVYRSYGNPQMNCILPYPTVIYLPQPPYQCTSPGIACPIGAVPEMFHYIAAPPVPYCLSPDSK